MSAEMLHNEALAVTCQARRWQSSTVFSAGVSLLGKFISVREPNIKYLGLENMVRLAEVPAVADTINRCCLFAHKPPFKTHHPFVCASECRCHQPCSLLVLLSSSSLPGL